MRKIVAFGLICTIAALAACGSKSDASKESHKGHDHSSHEGKPHTDGTRK